MLTTSMREATAPIFSTQQHLCSPLFAPHARPPPFLLLPRSSSIAGGDGLLITQCFFPRVFFCATVGEKNARKPQRGDGASSSIGGMPPKRQGPAGPTAREQAALNMKSAGEQLLYRVALGAVLAVTGALTFFPPMC